MVLCIFAAMQLDDQHIVKNMRQGDRGSFETMFRTWYNPLCNYAFSFLGRREESEEIVQNVFVQFWEKREEIEIETSLKSYLYRAVRNTCFNVLKHEKVKREHARYTLERNEHHSSQGGATLLAQELEVKISQALSQLPEQCAIIFKMSRFEEMKYAEIAEKLGLSIKTVENQMGKALRIMREQLKDYLPLLALVVQSGIWLQIDGQLVDSVMVLISLI
ncbi:MAG TPA: RNA polymerase sigma-70 factor [Flavobacteriales bacterium]